jgi:hypothetical protein
MARLSIVTRDRCRKETRPSFDFESEEFSYCAPATLPDADPSLHAMACKMTSRASLDRALPR